MVIEIIIGWIVGIFAGGFTGYVTKNKKIAFGVGLVVGFICGFLMISIMTMNEGLRPSYDDYLSPFALVVIGVQTLGTGLVALLARFVMPKKIKSLEPIVK